MLYKGDKKARLYKGDAHPAEWYKGGDKITGFTTESKSGEHIEFSDSYNGKFDELTVYGMSEQKSYAGLNLALCDKTTAFNAYQSIIVSDDGNNNTITLQATGGAWGGRGFVLPKPLSFGQTVYIKATIETEYGIAPVVSIEGWRTGGTVRVTNSETTIRTEYQAVTIKTPTDGEPIDFYVIRFSTFHSGGWSTAGETITYRNIMLTNTNGADFEPYVGGKPAPNMDFPQPIVDLEAETAVAGRNLIPYPYAGGAYVENKGIIWTVKPDGTIVANGTNTSNDNAYYNVALNQNNRRIPMKKGTYTISSSRAGIYVAGGFRDSAGNIVNATNGSPSFNISNGSTYTFTVNEDFELFMYLFIAKGVTVNNAELKVMIEPGTTHAKYEPYREPQEIAITARGIPVPRNGNYTDANGQQWYCDTVDLARGKYIQRVKRTTLTLTKATYNTIYGYRWANQTVRDAAVVHNEIGDTILCDKLRFNAASATGTPQPNRDGIRMSGSFKTVVAEFQDDEHNAVDVEVAYMINPVETDLDAFTTLFPTTIIDSNTDRVTATAKVVDGGTT
ncbi:MAG: hypothetical protein MJY89_07825 [Bacteroidales bacterium]|nr:hypothetical protein [Bacteroidales bacterium]